MARVPSIISPTSSELDFPSLFGDVSTRFDSWLENIMGDAFKSSYPLRGAGYPKVDVYETEKSLSIEASIPGLTKEDVKVEWADNLLTIAATKQSSPTEGGKLFKYRYQLKELHKSSFSRTFSVPSNKYKVDETVAEVKDGLLKIEIPLIEPTTRPVKQISVK